MEIFTLKAIVNEDEDGENSSSEQYQLFRTQAAAIRFVAREIKDIQKYGRFEDFFDPNPDLDDGEYQIVGSIANNWYKLEFFLKKDIVNRLK